LLTHLAGSAPPFESLINAADPRFQQPGDMPLKIQAFCRETHQTVPRKPGPIIRCVLESLALLYHKTLQEIEDLTGCPIARVYLLDGSANSLLNHFIANAVRRPLVVAPADVTAYRQCDRASSDPGSPEVTRSGAGDRAEFVQDGDDPPIRHRLGFGLRSTRSALCGLIKPNR
jgi:hypothetical protein